MLGFLFKLIALVISMAVAWIILSVIGFIGKVIFWLVAFVLVLIFLAMF